MHCLATKQGEATQEHLSPGRETTPSAPSLPHHHQYWVNDITIQKYFKIYLTYTFYFPRGKHLGIWQVD